MKIIDFVRFINMMVLVFLSHHNPKMVCYGL